MNATRDAGHDCTHLAIDASEPRYQSPTLAFASANKRRGPALLSGPENLVYTPPVTCPAGQTTELTHAALGPETAPCLVA